jgi:hypothetical protein
MYLFQPLANPLWKKSNPIGEKKKEIEIEKTALIGDT